MNAAVATHAHNVAEVGLEPGCPGSISKPSVSIPSPIRVERAEDVGVGGDRWKVGLELRVGPIVSGLEVDEALDSIGVACGERRNLVAPHGPAQQACSRDSQAVEELPQVLDQRL